MTHFSEAEKQIILSLAWFRTRYALFLNLEMDRKADQKSIEEFGKIWMGNFKCNWSNAFDTLVKKGILSFAQGEYQFTAKGELVKKEVESKTPFFKYEYDHFFDSERNSKAHSIFCINVYGLDLSQHGLIDMDELSILINKLRNLQATSIADIGCGNGKITEYIAEQTQANITGIDISEEGIKLANKRTEKNNYLRFIVGNLNSLELNNNYDAIVFLDTLYYSNDIKNTIKKAVNGLTENGRIYAYFSQWIMSEEYAENLQPENTYLAKTLSDLGLKYSYTDLTTSGIKHWKKKLKVLEEMKIDFVNEDKIDLWEYRQREAFRYANWGDHKYSRYLYEVAK